LPRPGRAYGFPFDPRLWIASFLHDLGYIGKRNLDGREGQTHVELGAAIMEFSVGNPWGDFTRYHSRFYSKRDGQHFSRLCVVDKLALALTPAWRYLSMVQWTGEIDEYMTLSKQRASQGEPQFATPAPIRSRTEQWFAQLQEYGRRWVHAHKEGRADTWTPAMITSSQHLART
jgi:hypothetical protein